MYCLLFVYALLMPLRTFGKGNRGEVTDEFGSERRTRKSILSAARELRQNATPAEKMLWKCIRKKALNGLKFYRQAPIDRFIVDFYCPAKKIIVEIDGSVHQEQDQHEYDLERESELKSMGFRILRFSNDDVFNHLAEVCANITKECNNHC